MEKDKKYTVKRKHTTGNKVEVSFVSNDGFEIKMSEYPDSLLGKVMYDMHFFNGLGCRDKEAYVEALTEIAKQIIDNVKHNKF